MNAAEPDKKKMLQRRAFQLATEQRTMVLAASAADAMVWAAPVYFVFYKNAFWFFSNPTARHSVYFAVNQVGCAVIFQDGDSLEAISGLQMTGRIKKTTYSPVALGVFLAYLDKFGFIKNFFESDRPIELRSFLERFNTSMYRFSPEEIYCQDDSISFGHRQLIDTIGF